MGKKTQNMKDLPKKIAKISKFGIINIYIYVEWRKTEPITSL